ncbi:unnamed protein product, partial [Timema podura]|nr:unnamed protein product [Timema podura]
MNVFSLKRQVFNEELNKTTKCLPENKDEITQRYCMSGSLVRLRDTEREHEEQEKLTDFERNVMREIWGAVVDDKHGPLGKLRTRWSDDVARDLKELVVEGDWREKAQDRTRWSYDVARDLKELVVEEIGGRRLRTERSGVTMWLEISRSWLWRGIGGRWLRTERSGVTINAGANFVFEHHIPLLRDAKRSLGKQSIGAYNHRKKPLQNRRIYLDVKNCAVSSKLEANLKSLGAVSCMHI